MREIIEFNPIGMLPNSIVDPNGGPGILFLRDADGRELQLSVIPEVGEQMVWALRGLFPSIGRPTN